MKVSMLVMFVVVMTSFTDVHGWSWFKIGSGDSKESEESVESKDSGENEESKDNRNNLDRGDNEETEDSKSSEVSGDSEETKDSGDSKGSEDSGDNLDSGDILDSGDSGVNGDNTDCGKVEEYDPERESFVLPWLANLILDYNGHQECIGIVVNKKHILTTAFCLYPWGKDKGELRPSQIYVKDEKIFDVNDNKPKDFKIIAHPDFNKGDLRMNMAIIKFTEEQNMEHHACLPGHDDNPSFNNLHRIETDWHPLAKHNKARAVKMVDVVDSQEKCYGNDGPLSSSNWCARNEELDGRIEYAFELLGAPLALHNKEDNKMTLIGMSSNGWMGSYTAVYGSYVKVAQGRNWIEEILRDE